jgi:hypothetical protein
MVAHQGTLIGDFFVWLCVSSIVHIQSDLWKVQVLSLARPSGSKRPVTAAASKQRYIVTKAVVDVASL